MKKIFFLTLCFLSFHVAFSQHINFTIDQSSLIYDKVTGEKIPYEKYKELQKKEVGAYRLDPVFNEFGAVESFKLRRATTEEQTLNITSFDDLDSKPKVGETIPLFVMKGIDGKTYRSTDLKGNIILISFWIKISRPFWNPALASETGELIKPFQAKGDFISLGIIDEPKENLEKYMATQALPFVAIPDSYAFHKKFGVRSVPAFMIIDKSGKVAGFIEGYEPEQLKKLLTDKR